MAGSRVAFSGAERVIQIPQDAPAQIGIQTLEERRVDEVAAAEAQQSGPEVQVLEGMAVDCLAVSGKALPEGGISRDA